MGAWSASNFDNDDALDWLDDLCDSGDESSVRSALSTVAEWPADEYLEAIDCCVALAAAEIVAAALGNPAADLPEETEDWLDRNAWEPGAEEIRLAHAVITRIKVNSELKDLWEDSDSYDEWLAVIQDLESRLP